MDNGRVWGEFIMSVARGENIVLNSDGMMELALTYVGDAVSGIFFALLNGNEFVYNISNSNEIIRVRDLAKTCAKIYPEKGLKVSSEIYNDERYLKNKVAFLDSGEIEKLGWVPKVSLADGLKRTARIKME